MEFCPRGFQPHVFTSPVANEGRCTYCDGHVINTVREQGGICAVVEPGSPPHRGKIHFHALLIVLVGQRDANVRIRNPIEGLRIDGFHVQMIRLGGIDLLLDPLRRAGSEGPQGCGRQKPQQDEHVGCEGLSDEDGLPGRVRGLLHDLDRRFVAPRGHRRQT